MCVRWGGSVSSKFTVSNGVRQGGILSPFLLNVYMDDLSVNLKKCPRYKSIYWQPCRLDCHIHNTQYNTGIIKNIYTYINKFELV